MTSGHEDHELVRGISIDINPSDRDNRKFAACMMVHNCQGVDHSLTAAQ